MENKYREGTLGAMLDEYKRAADELRKTIVELNQDRFTAIADKKTEDPECVSIQSVMNHTINAGYGYTYYLLKNFIDPENIRVKPPVPQSPQEAASELDKMMEYTITKLTQHFSPDLLEVEGKEFKVAWGQNYDFEQMLEHAIVHILRHRRQIERFKSKF